MTARGIVRRQLRGFVTFWSALTLMIAIATFFAIYLTYGGDGLGAAPRNIAIPITTSTRSVAVAVSTLPPTLQVASTTAPMLVAQNATPTEEAIVTEESVATEEVDSADLSAARAVTTEEAPPPPTATTLPVEDTRFQVGIQVQPDPGRNVQQQNNWMNEVRNKMGFGWYKLQVRWEDIEPEKGEYDWGAIDYAIQTAADNNLKVLVSVVTAPEWAREPGVDTSKQGPPANPEDYLDFVKRLLRRAEGKIHAIEVWNEQNLDREWMSNGGLDAASYVDLLRQTYELVKRRDPGMIVVSGALSPGGGWTEADGTVSAVDDFTYMQGMIDAGLLNYTDCVGAHHNGYNIGPSVLWDAVEDDPEAEFRGPFDNPHRSWSFRSTLEQYNRQIQLAGGTQKLCVTEFGWASTEDLAGTPPGFEFANDNTLEEQREWTIEALNNMEEWEFVWLAFIWNFNYGPQAGWNPDNDNVPYSIIGPEWVHRPVYSALIEWQQARVAAGLP